MSDIIAIAFATMLVLFVVVFSIFFMQFLAPLLVKDHRSKLRLLSGIIEELPMFLFATDSSGNIRYAEGKLLDNLSLGPDKFVGRSVFTLYPDEPLLRGDVTRALSGELVTSTVEMFGLTLDVWYHPVKNRRGNSTGIIGFAIDVTERKQLTDMLQTQIGVMQHVTNPVLSVDMDMHIISANLAANIQYGDDRIPLVGRHLSEIPYIESPHDWYTSLDHAIQRDGKWQTELILACSGREKQYMLTSATLIQNETGKGIEIVIVQHDITERKALNERAIELKLEKERVKLFRDFVRDFSHDLRTPLTIVQTSLEIIELKTPGVDKNHTQRIYQQINHIISLVEDLVQLSRLDFEATKLDGSPVLINSFLTQIVEGIRPVAGSKKLDLKYVATDHMLYVISNQSNLTRAITNIITNAVQYTDPGGDIVVLLDYEDGSAVIRVKDTGIGIAPEDLPNVFKRLFRADRARSVRSGSGLGLAIAKKIIERHQGGITVTSELQKGTTFEITLPVVDPSTLTQDLS